MRKNLFLILVLLVLALALVACTPKDKTTDNTDTHTIYKVTFYLLNGNSPVVVDFDESFELPDDPTRRGYEFGGWYVNQTCAEGSEWTVPETLSADVEVYAKWTAVPFNVHFFLAEGYDEIVMVADDTLIAPTNMVITDSETNEVLIFDGWYSDSALTKKWKGSTNIYNDITVYAKWTTISEILAKFDSKKNFTATVSSKVGDTVKDKGTYNYLGDDVQICKVVDGVEYYDYLELTNEQAYIYWVDTGLGHHDDVAEDDSRFEDYYYSINTLDLSATSEYAFDYVDDKFVVKDVQTFALQVFGNYGIEWNSVVITVNDAKITQIALDSDEAVLTFNLNNYGSISFVIPEKYVPEHEHDFGDSYFIFQQCSFPDCTVIGRKSSTNSAKDKFVYEFTSEKKDEIDACYDAMMDNLDKKEDEPALETLFEQYNDYVEYVIEQYQIAKVFYSVDPEGGKEDFDFVSQYYNDVVSKYYSIFGYAYDIPEYRVLFYEGWTEEEIKIALDYSDSYGDEEYKRIKDDIDALLLEYDEYLESIDDPAKYKSAFNEMYSRLVKLNNELAQKVGDYDNYMDYAYAIKYERYFKPEDANSIRKFVKQYIVPTMEAVYEKYRQTNTSIKTNGWPGGDADKLMYNGCLNSAIFGNMNPSKYTVAGVNYIAEYFKEMSSTNYAQDIDFYTYLEKLFEDGNYYLGADKSAYSYWIRAQETSILYFGSGYQDVFTFVHEFGHYYNNIYNGGLSGSMELKETHSQGNEMMFLAWLAAHKGEDVSDIAYNAVSTYSLVNMLYVVAIATAVDEFEQAAYTGYYNGEKLVENSNGVVDYASLFNTILNQYGDLMEGNEMYWSYVVFQSAGYYISYAISALPSIELYVLGVEDFESAKDAYFKLFTFSDEEEFVQTDDNGDREVVANYSDILAYCGLNDIFDEEFYKYIAEFFKSMK